KHVQPFKGNLFIYFQNYLKLNVKVPKSPKAARCFTRLRVSTRLPAEQEYGVDSGAFPLPLSFYWTCLSPAIFIPFIFSVGI
uniref:Uncharacterized protein n=1 Tax=Gasterosteus aculeatus TaxID=69293 RepID=G3PMZ7_GASAC